MKKTILFLIAAVMLFCMTACQSAPQDADAVVIAIQSDENNLSPYTYVTATGSTVNRLIYDTLFTADLDNELIPWMVEEDYTVADGFRTYTFTLAEGQKFQDGTPVTTTDIAFSLTYNKNTDDIEAIDLADDRTMTVRLKASDVTYLRKTLAETRIVSKAQYENAEDPASVAAPVGSGMYRLKEYKVGEYYILEAVEDYFKGTPKVKTINMPIMEDATAMQTALLSGQIAASTAGIGIEMRETFAQKEEIEILSSAGYAPMLMVFNNERAPFDDAAFRNAMTYAIDVTGIMRTLYADACTVGTKGVVRSDAPYAQAGLEYTYDPARAAELLEDAGYSCGADGIRTDKNGEPLRFETLVYSGNTARIRAAELISEQLKELGITMTVKVMEMDTVDAYVWPNFDVSVGRDYDAAMWGWGTSIRPNFLATLFSSDPVIGNCNIGGYRSAAMDAVIEADYAAAQTEEELYEALAEMQQIAAEDPSFLCFGYADTLQACNTALYDGFKAGKGLNLVNLFSFLDV